MKQNQPNNLRVAKPILLLSSILPAVIVLMGWALFDSASKVNFYFLIAAIIAAIASGFMMARRRFSTNTRRFFGGLILTFLIALLNASLIFTGCFFPAMNSTSRVTRPRFQPNADSAAQMAETAKLIPVRPAKLDSSKVDLTSFYNSSLNERFREIKEPPPRESFWTSLSIVPPRLLRADGIDFDARGVIRLRGNFEAYTGRRFPPEVRSIALERKCEEIYFLHGCDWSGSVGQIISKIKVHYANHETREIDFTYGKDVSRTWVWSDMVTGADMTASWQASLGDKKRELLVRLFVKKWINPLPGEKIETINYQSAMTDAVPFLIAITTK